MATKTAVIVIRGHEILIWAIPPLSSQPPDFSFDEYPTGTHGDMMLPPFITIPIPYDVALHPENSEWDTISPWYFGTSLPLYFDMLPRDDSRIHRVKFMLNLKPDLSTASLHLINTSETMNDFDDDETFENYRICEDTVVSGWSYLNYCQTGLYMQSTSARFVNVISHSGLTANIMSSPDIERDYLLYLCPASGRFVLLDRSNTISVLDFF